jgi:hypothetical protein
MKPLRLILPLVVLSLIAFPASAWHFHSCDSLNYIAHGTFQQVGDCMQFTPDPSLEIPKPLPFEIVNQGSWKDGMVGTVYAMTTDPLACGAAQALQICDWDADYSRNVVGTLVFLNSIECPGYYIRQAGVTTKEDYFIRNHEDFPELFVPENLEKKIKAEVYVYTWITNCLGKNVSHMIDYDLLPNQ